MVRLTTAICILAMSSSMALAEGVKTGDRHDGGVQIAANMSSNPMDANARMRKKHKMMKSGSSMNKNMSGNGMNNGNGMSGNGMNNNGMSGNGMKNNGMGNNGMSK